MDIQNDPEYLRLLSAIERSTRDLENCTQPDYVPACRRLKVWALADMGNFLFQKGLYQDAVHYYHLALKIDCDYTPVLNQMAVCFIHLNKYVRAADIFALIERRSFHSTQDKAQAWYNLAYVYSLDKDWDNAVTCMTKCLKFNDNPADRIILEAYKERNSREKFMQFTNNIFKKDLLAAERKQPNHAESFRNKTKMMGQ